MSSFSTVALWLFVINLGVAFGAGIYEHRIVVPRWVGDTRVTKPFWNPVAATQDDAAAGSGPSSRRSP